MSLAKLNVAITRVKRLCHVAIWPGRGQKDHLYGLAFKPMLVAWQSYYTRAGLWRAGEQLLPRGTFPFSMCPGMQLGRAAM